MQAMPCTCMPHNSHDVLVAGMLVLLRQLGQLSSVLLQSVLSCCRTTATPCTPAWHSGKRWTCMGAGPDRAWMRARPRVCRGSWPSRLKHGQQQKASAAQSDTRQSRQLPSCTCTHTQQCYCLITYTEWHQIDIQSADRYHKAFAAMLQRRGPRKSPYGSAPDPGSSTWLATCVVFSPSPLVTYVHTSCCRAPPAYTHAHVRTHSHKAKSVEPTRVGVESSIVYQVCNVLPSDKCCCMKLQKHELTCIYRQAQGQTGQALSQIKLNFRSEQ
jgi:hypothetical protein